MHLEPVDMPLLGEHHDVAVRRRDVQLLDEIAVLRRHTHSALAAPLLSAVQAQG